MAKKEFSVIVPEAVFPKPSAREISAAYILLEYFRADIKFVPRNNRKTPDFLIKGLYWELKTPVGTGKYNKSHRNHQSTQDYCHHLVAMLI